MKEEGSCESDLVDARRELRPFVRRGVSSGGAVTLHGPAGAFVTPDGKYFFFSRRQTADGKVTAASSVNRKPHRREFSPDAADSIRLNFSQNHDAAVKAVERIAQMIARYRIA